MECLTHLLTEKDNRTMCPVRSATALTAITYHAAAVAGVVLGQVHLDIATLGQYLQHMATLIGVGGTTVGVKSALKADAEKE